MFSCAGKTSYLNLSSGRKVSEELVPIKNILDEHAQKWYGKHVFSMQNAMTQNSQGKVRSLYQLLVAQEAMEIPQARVFLVESVNSLLENTDTDLFEQPFSAKNLHVSILFHDKKGQLLQSEGYLSKLVLQDGVLRYYERGHKKAQHFERSAFYRRAKEDENLQLVEQELFDEASELVEQQSYLSNYFSQPSM